MEQQKCYENYPFWMVIISNIVSLSIYIIGGFLVYQIGLLWLLFYICYILILEIKLLRGHCVNCYYFGKTCFSGRGRLSSLFFKRGELIKFNDIKITWKDIIPDFLVSVVPILGGIVILVKKFDWIILLLMAALFFLGFLGNGLVRGHLACKYCKQRELGCPAQKLFNKNK
jgi:hypothetical protein